MSDCSTNAMKPKETKTCGNCGVIASGDRVTTCGVRCIGACENWNPRTAVPARRNEKTLEQRYQQLEQVARILLRNYTEIYEVAEQHLGAYWTHQEFASPAGAKKILVKLGVSLDD